MMCIYIYIKYIKYKIIIKNISNIFRDLLKEQKIYLSQK